MFASRLGCASALLRGVHHRMARRRRNRKLRNQVQRIAGRNRAHRKISIDRQNLFSGTGSVAAQAVFILIHGRRQHRGSVARADARDVLLRDANQRRGRKDSDRFRSMRVVAVHAGRMAIVVQQNAFRRVMRIGRGRERMADLGRCVLRQTHWRTAASARHSCRRCGRKCNPVHSARAAAAPDRSHCAAHGTRCTHRQPRWDSFRAKPAERSCLWKERARWWTNRPAD